MRILLLLLLLMAGGPVMSQAPYLFSYFTDNGQDGLHLAYSSDGYRWTALQDGKSYLRPELGQEKLMRDPCIIQGPDKRFHLVWTVGWNERGIGYASSDDLIHWSTQQYLPVMEHEPNARNCWAPEVVYVKEEQCYYLFWSTTISGRFMETDSTAESNYNHRVYYTTTADFRTFSPTRLLYDGGYNVIDATVLPWRNQWVFLVKNETRYPVPEKNLWVIEAASMHGPFAAPRGPITGSYWAEGPTACRVGKDWVVYFDKYRDHQMGALRSRDLHHWEDISEDVVFPAGVRHGTVFRVGRRHWNSLVAEQGNK